MSNTATIDVADVQRLMAQRDIARAERARARDTAAALESICAEAYNLLFEAITPHASHAEEAELGRRIARFLREHGADAGPGRVVL